MTLQERILSNTKVNENGCWIFQGHKDHYGYGSMSFGKVAGKVRKRGAHRLSAHAFLGFDLDSPLRVCHTCDTPACCNPEHFFFGTQSDNLKDCYDKGRIGGFVRRLTGSKECPT